MVIILGLNTNAPSGTAINPPSPPKPDGPSRHAKIGIAIAVILLFVVTIIVAVWCYCDKRRQSEQEVKATLYAEVEKYGEPMTVRTFSNHDKPGKAMGRE